MVDLPSLPVAEVTKIVLGGLSIFENNKPALMVLILVTDHSCYRDIDVSILMLNTRAKTFLKLLSLFKA